MKKKRMTKKRASELFRKVFGIYAGMVMVSCRSHEDINDEDQTITFKVGSLKPTLPPNKGGGLLSALKTGDFSDITPFAIALIGTGTIILSIVIYNFIKKKKCEE